MKTYKIFAVLSVVCLLQVSCLKLDEVTYGKLSPTTYYQNETEALSSVVGVSPNTEQMSFSVRAKPVVAGTTRVSMK